MVHNTAFIYTRHVLTAHVQNIATKSLKYITAVRPPQILSVEWHELFCHAKTMNIV